MTPLMSTLAIAPFVVVIVIWFGLVAERKFQEQFKNCEICGSENNLTIIEISSASDIPWYRCEKHLKGNSKRKGTYKTRFPKTDYSKRVL